MYECYCIKTIFVLFLFIITHQQHHRHNHHHRQELQHQYCLNFHFSFMFFIFYLENSLVVFIGISGAEAFTIVDVATYFLLCQVMCMFIYAVTTTATAATILR